MDVLKINPLKSVSQVVDYEFKNIKK